jgi:hypothetical protein
MDGIGSDSPHQGWAVLDSTSDHLVRRRRDPLGRVHAWRGRNDGPVAWLRTYRPRARWRRGDGPRSAALRHHPRGRDSQGVGPGPFRARAGDGGGICSRIATEGRAMMMRSAGTGRAGGLLSLRGGILVVVGLPWCGPDRTASGSRGGRTMMFGAEFTSLVRTWLCSGRVGLRVPTPAPCTPRNLSLTERAVGHWGPLLSPLTRS